jgi:type I restriction enzyme, R subunit
LFNEKNTVQEYICKILTTNPDSKIKWKRIIANQLQRDETQVLIEPILAQKLIEFNPEIEQIPDRADEVIYKLIAAIESANNVGLVRANEEFVKILKEPISMPYGDKGKHIPIKIIDFEHPENNELNLVTELTVKSKEEIRADIVLLVNGIPLVVIETKTPVRPSISWLDGATQISEDYEKSVPEFFVPNVFSAATEQKELWYGSVGSPPEELWEPWKKKDESENLLEFEKQISSLFDIKTIFEMLEYYTVFSTDSKSRKIKMIARYPQYEAANLIVNRVVENKTKSGLIWHFQGSGKSLLMILTAMRLRQHKDLRNPTVIIVVDRVDLDSQIAGKFNASQVPNTIQAESRSDLEKLLKKDTRKIIITTIHKFGEVDAVLNQRDNIVVLVDEADRSQDGDLGKLMRKALPNAFLFGLTGTPVNEKDRNTFTTFGAEVDGPTRYLHRYSFEDSVTDHCTLPINFEPRPVKLKFNREEFDKIYSQITSGLTNVDEQILSEKAGKLKEFLSSDDTIDKKSDDIIKHYRENVEPNGFKAMIVAYDRNCVDKYKKALAKRMDSGEFAVVMSISNSDSQEWKDDYSLTRDEQSELLKKFTNPNNPLKILIVTSKLLRGFDASILQTMYLDKPLKNQGLLQAVCRTNRLYPNKTNGIIVDYVGVFDQIGKALAYDLGNVSRTIVNIDEIKNNFEKILFKCIGYFEGMDRTDFSYVGLIAAQNCFKRPSSSYLNEQQIKDYFAEDFTTLQKYWNILNPTYTTLDQSKDIHWLSQVYQSLKPSTGEGLRVWKKLGLKVLETINKNTKLEKIENDLNTLKMDENLLNRIKSGESSQEPQVIEIMIINRLQKYQNKKDSIVLGRKLEDIKKRYNDGMLTNVQWLNELLKLAAEIVESEKKTTTVNKIDHTKALTRIFNKSKTKATPKEIEEIVLDIDKIVHQIIFDGWQETNAGVKLVQKNLFTILMKHNLHADEELFDSAYDYISRHY